MGQRTVLEGFESGLDDSFGDCLQGYDFSF
jgi:hypothetical protein